jgi:hypothetical protein
MTWSERIVIVAGLCSGCLAVPERGTPCAADGDCELGAYCYRSVCVAEADAGLAVPPTVDTSSHVREGIDAGPTVVQVADTGNTSVSDAGFAGEVADAGSADDGHAAPRQSNEAGERAKGKGKGKGGPGGVP